MRESNHKQWIQPPQNLNLSVPYIKATVLRPINNRDLQCQLQTDRGAVRVVVPFNKSYEVSEQTQYSDMCEMNVLNEPQVLSNIIRRYKKDEIFTSIGPTLIVLNPYRKIDRLFNQQILNKISKQINSNRLEKHEPHIYIVAAKAYLALKEYDSKQAIVISGESGAGKTESAKYCMQLLTSISKKKNHSIEQKILACNPLLEAFGNSKTVRNQNSSRFGKYLKIYFDHQNSIKGASIYSYLLQKSRVVSISSNQRSFHCFYALTASGMYDTQQSSHYAFLRRSGCYVSNYIEDKKYFEDINLAFTQIGFTASEVDKIWDLISCILKLGNIDFDETNHRIDQSKPCEIIDPKQMDKISESVKVQSKYLEKILLYQKKKFIKEHTLSAYNREGCRSNRNNLCKALYNSVFQFILSKIQTNLKPQKSSPYREINILDIFGFQNFQQNSFQQFCINFTNEKLLKLYNIYVFDREMEILKEDGLQKQVMGISPPTNDQIINMIGGKLSLVSLINDMTLPQYKDEDIIQSFHRIQNVNLSFDKLNKNKFCIIHTQCPVVYSIVSFKSKNQDKVNDQVLDIVNNLFQNNIRQQFGKTILSKFTKQIDELISQLNKSTVHFIRCIKPNEAKQPYNPEQKYILNQVRYLGIFQTIMVRKNIFPFRKTYVQFYRQFKLLFPLFKKEKNEKVVTTKILKELSKKQNNYLLGNHRVYISAELEQTLNNQIFKYLKLRNQKIRKIQIGLKRCLDRKKILYNLHILVSRIRILKILPCKLENTVKRNALSTLKWYSTKAKQKQKRQWQEKQLRTLKEAQKARQQMLLRLQLQKQQQKRIQISNFVDKIQLFIRSIQLGLIVDTFYILKNVSRLTVDTSQISLSRLYNKMNETALVNSSVIDSHSPYKRPYTPSSELMGQSITFNKEFLEGIKKNSSSKSIENSNIVFPEGLQIEPFQFFQNEHLQRLKNILSEQYKVHFQGSEQDFYSPLSQNCRFKLEDLSQQQLIDIINFPIQNFFNKILRKRTTFLGSKKNYEEILVFKKGVLTKSMTVLSNEQDEKRCLEIFKIILKIGNQQQIQTVLKYVEKFVDQCQNSTMQIKKQIMVQLLRQSNTSQQLTAIRIYQTMSVFLHVYNVEQDLMKAALNLLYWKLQQKSKKTNQQEYIRYIFGTIVRKIEKKAVVGYLPINYQIMGLMCRRQISIPVYLPTGNSVLIKVQAYHNFSQIKYKCIKQFGINVKRFSQQLFTFFQLINFDNEQLEETPIKQTNMVWDMMTYWELTKDKYVQCEIKPPNFFLMLKMRYVFQLYPNDEEGIELYFSQNYFDYFMGKIILEDKLMFYLAGLLHHIKYYSKELKEVVLALLPIWVTKKMKKEEAIHQLNNVILDIQGLNLTNLQAKYKFVQICSKSPLCMSMTIPTQQSLKLFLRTRSLCLLKEQSDKVEVIPLRNLVKWLIEKDYFIFQVLSKSQSQENRVIKIQTDSASICNQFLKCISQFKAKYGQVANFKKK